MKKIQTITESDINRIVKKSIKENKNNLIMESGVIDLAALLTTFGVLSGFGVLATTIRKKIIKKLKDEGKSEEAEELEKKLKNRWKFDLNTKRDDTGGVW